MRLTGLGLAALAVLGGIIAIKDLDWDLLRQILLMTGALIIALGLAFGFMWALVKIFTRKPVNELSRIHAVETQVVAPWIFA